MKFLAITNPGLSHVTQSELTLKNCQEITVDQDCILFQTASSQISTLLTHLQAPKRVILYLDSNFTCEQLCIKAPTVDFLPKIFTYKIEFEGVRGQENRTALLKTLAPLLGSYLEKQNVKATYQPKNPTLTFVICYSQTTYYLGIDLAGDLSSRPYRLFAHTASLKGDLAFSIIHNCELESNQKILIGFAKDGVLGIEAALFLNNLPVRDISLLPINHLSIKDLSSQVPLKPATKTNIDLFETTIPNLNAIRKNSALAKVSSYLFLHKGFIDDLDVRFEATSFDRVLVHLTTKDETKINEIYYQSEYVLKSKGLLLLFTRSTFQITPPTKFDLVSTTPFVRGDNQSLL